MIQYFSCIIIDIFCNILMSFKLLFCTLQFPFLSVLSEPSSPYCFYLSSMFCYLKAFHTNQPFTTHMHKASRHIHFMHLMLALKPEEVYATKELSFQRCFVSDLCSCFHLILRRLPALHCLLHRHQTQYIFEPRCHSINQ